MLIRTYKLQIRNEKIMKLVLLIEELKLRKSQNPQNELKFLLKGLSSNDLSTYSFGEQKNQNLHETITVISKT